MKDTFQGETMFVICQYWELSNYLRQEAKNYLTSPFEAKTTGGQLLVSVSKVKSRGSQLSHFDRTSTLKT